jgi:UbiD family decarboxylase
MMAAVTSVEYGVDELGIAGAIRGCPLELARALTVDVEFPACCEVVIEGYIRPDEFAPEGPFGDFMGYYVPRDKNPVIHVTAITHRKRALFQGIRAGSYEDSVLLALSREAAIIRALRREGIPVAGVNLTPNVFMGVIALRSASANEVRQAMEVSVKTVPWLKYLVVVNEDVDIFDWEDVLWAVATRGSVTKMMTFAGEGYPRDPFGLHKAKLAIDATFPWEEQASFTRASPFHPGQP